MAEMRDLFRQWKDGEITEDEYNEKVTEILLQMGVRI